jgi:hypothetical protein
MNHDLEILRAIADGAQAVDLKWPQDDVEAVLQRYGFVTTQGGSIVRRGLPVPPMLQLAGESSNSQVRRLAERARTALLALQKVLAQEHARQQSEVVHQQHVRDVDDFLLVLKQIETAAQVERDRLRRSAPRSRHTRAAS